jgi:tetratricopeptide (TPR) repeat protein
MTRPVVLHILLTLTSCRTPGLVYLSDPARFKNLPDEIDELVKLSDGIATAPHPSVREIDRALAALEKADHLGPKDPFEILWRLARACFLMTGELPNNDQSLGYAARGRDYATSALQINRARVEPHLYLAYNLAKIAEAKSSLKYIRPMVAEAQEAARIDERYDGASPLRFLGKVYLTAPAWPVSIGSADKALEYLERAVQLAPNPMNHLFLGEAYYSDEQYGKAKQLIQRALREPGRASLDARWKKEAEEYLRRLENESSHRLDAVPCGSSGV